MGVAYKDALISGEFWNQQELVKEWFGNLENPDKLDFEIEGIDGSGSEEE